MAPMTLTPDRRTTGVRTEPWVRATLRSPARSDSSPLPSPPPRSHPRPMSAADRAGASDSMVLVFLADRTTIRGESRRP
jgi:hypothetical protein